MGKWLLVALVVVIVFWVLKVYRKHLDRASPSRPTPAVEDMVRCAHCGVHVPRSESLASGERHFCSEEHRRLYRQG
ncbi:MAG: preprotein translocase subunit YajC [Azospira oryzae]|uniref:Preprotein translocase subunit YajC n=1 Tax=Pelomicrobium methylotrophicum TaxID=2602750 RepID=A0A5C7EYD3_9PROT|nr:PP0621 family protein [Pelomicrobium methylotrophicum]PZP60726.1 MAG: preprotein translocase subunit YajC [Azospira oryzae]PZP80757.1 MAG: preprotein translocase subunit YajC [Azospira oryzae]TXF12071.1 preprotein translocase subunit YajC [Pelomicrobium methylotrophicum]